MALYKKDIIMNKLTKYYHKKINSNKIGIRTLNTLNCGAWEWNIDKDEMFVSERIKELTGDKLLNIKSVNEFIDAIVCKEDRIKAIKDLYDYINGKKSFYESIFRLKNKELEWVMVAGKILKNRFGCNTLFLGSILKLNKNLNISTNNINKKFFIQKINNFLDKGLSHHNKMAIIYISIDNFKGLNLDLDDKLKFIVIILFHRLVVKIIDKYSKLIRLDRYKFVVLVRKFNNIRHIENICKQIQKKLNHPFKIMNHEVYMIISMGISIFPDDAMNSCELFKYSKFAVNNSKSKGRNKYTFFNKEVFSKYNRRILIENEIKNLTNSNELEIYYQPQVDILRGEIIGVEALLRWNSKKLGRISPGEFIPIVEYNKYIIKIGKWVLDEVISTISQWKKMKISLESIGVNISPVQLEKVDFKSEVLNLCTKYKVSPSLLELEITEDVSLKICENTIKTFKGLADNNVRIALDDFGTKYSSLEYLLLLPVSTLKIDKLFVDNIRHEKNKILIKSMVDLCRTLNCKMIVEGVETKEQLSILSNLGCSIIQGYYFSKPLSKIELENLLLSKKNYGSKLYV